MLQAFSSHQLASCLTTSRSPPWEQLSQGSVQSTAAKHPLLLCQQIQRWPQTPQALHHLQQSQKNHQLLSPKAVQPRQLGFRVQPRRLSQGQLRRAVQAPSHLQLWAARRSFQMQQQQHLPLLGQLEHLWGLLPRQRRVLPQLLLRLCLSATRGQGAAGIDRLVWSHGRGADLCSRTKTL